MRTLLVVDPQSVSPILSCITNRKWMSSDRFRIITVMDRSSQDFSQAERSTDPRLAVKQLGQEYQNMIEQAAYELQKEFTDCLVNTCVLDRDFAEATIIEADAWHADLIAIGYHHINGLQKLLTGNISEEVLRRSECSVLFIPVTYIDGVRRFQIDMSVPLSAGNRIIS